MKIKLMSLDPNKEPIGRVEGLMGPVISAKAPKWVKINIVPITILLTSVRTSGVTALVVAVTVLDI
jgi:hypothetical protein